MDKNKMNTAAARALAILTREPQPLNGRTVLSDIDPEDEQN